MNNTSNEYTLYIVKENKEDIKRRFYAKHVYKNNNEAILEFRKLVRDDLLKKFDSVACIIECGTFSTQFEEQRFGKKQRLLHFLQRF